MNTCPCANFRVLFLKKLIILAIALGTEHGKCDFMTICILQTLRPRALLACPLSLIKKEGQLVIFHKTQKKAILSPLPAPNKKFLVE